ncbi:MAG: uracil-DNA glycosylase [bacterium]
MTGIDDRDWRDILLALERRLEALTAGGVNWLSVSADPALLAVLERAVPLNPETEEKEGPPARTIPTRAGPRGAPKDSSFTEPLPPPEIPEDRPSQAPPAEPPAEPPHPSDIDTLESLRFQYRECQKCPLGETRNRLVFGTGTGKPRLLFIGEGPGAEEDQQGLPFVGRAGALLTGLIEAMGLVREDVYITNVVKCRPPGNRNPAPAEVSSCRPILDRQIELLDPVLIVTLGNVPLKALNPSAGGITRERGRIFHFRQWRVLPTFHPSYLLRKPGEIGVCWNDFRQALMAAYPEKAAG